MSVTLELFLTSFVSLMSTQIMIHHYVKVNAKAAKVSNMNEFLGMLHEKQLTSESPILSNGAIYNQ